VISAVPSPEQDGWFLDTSVRAEDRFVIGDGPGRQGLLLSCVVRKPGIGSDIILLMARCHRIPEIHSRLRDFRLSRFGADLAADCQDGERDKMPSALKDSRHRLQAEPQPGKVSRSRDLSFVVRDTEPVVDADFAVIGRVPLTRQIVPEKTAEPAVLTRAELAGTTGFLDAIDGGHIQGGDEQKTG
jgi:hypothetical protein